MVGLIIFSVFLWTLMELVLGKLHSTANPKLQIAGPAILFLFLFSWVLVHFSLWQILKIVDGDMPKSEFWLPAPESELSNRPIVIYSNGVPMPYFRDYYREQRCGNGLPLNSATGDENIEIMDRFDEYLDAIGGLDSPIAR